MESLANLCWPTQRVGEALEALGRAAKLPIEAVEIPATDADPRVDPLAWEAWLESAAAWLGLEIEPTPLTADQLVEELLSIGPALLRLQVGNEPVLLPVLRHRRDQLLVVGPTGDIDKVDVSILAEHLLQPLRVQVADKVQNMNAVAAAIGYQGPEAKRFLGFLEAKELEGRRLHQVCWLLRLGGHRKFSSALKRAGAYRMIGTIGVAHFFAQAMTLVSMGLLGRSVINGSLEVAWLVAAALTMLTVIPLQIIVGWLQGKLGITVGLLLKRRLLYGALRYDINVLRQQSVGELLGRVMESEQLQGLALSAALGTLLAFIECVVGVVVLCFAPDPVRFIVMYLIIVVIAVLLAREKHERLVRWTDARLHITELLLERMLGHRTRLVQARPEVLHELEDGALQNYLRKARDVDFIQSVLSGFLPRLWMVLGMSIVLYDFVSGGVDPVAMAIGMGGTMLSYRALSSVLGAFNTLSTTQVAWQNIKPIYEAAERPAILGSTAAHQLDKQRLGDVAGSVLELRNIGYRYPGRVEPVLDGCSLGFNRGDLVLVEGRSGAGKSTLGSIVAGLREASSGAMFFRGLDQQTLGETRWRRRVVAVPQFQENHIFTESLAFNLLVGRRWPPTPQDLKDAERALRMLGLGPLLDRMPSGIHQVVGESGWRLSHGEKSRVYIARALLQRPDIVVYDESFGALDPDNALKCMRTAFAQVPTNVLIAHP